MATESLIVELDARTAKLDAKLNSTNDKLDKLSDKSEKADSGLKRMGSGAKVAGTAILQTAAAAVALAGAVSAIVVSSAKSRRELELLAKQAKTTTSDFQALSFATNTYGINGEQIADISKDIADKVGEFSAAGTGAFQDYADVMKLTKDQARETAQELEGLSSQEILGTLVSRMEDASVSGDKMTFVLESLGNDASRLIPLFLGNSKELVELKKRFDDVNKSLQITGTQAEALRDVSNTFTLLTASAGNATTAISATLAPVLDDFFNDIIAIVPDATQTIIDFVNSFLDAENITSIAGVNKEIAASMQQIADKDALIATQIGRNLKVQVKLRDQEQIRLDALNAQLEVLTAQEKKIEDVSRLSGGQIGGESPEPLQSIGIGTGDEIQAIEDRFKLEETLLAEKLARELQMIGDNKRLIRDLEDEFADNTLALEKKRQKERDKDVQDDKDEEKGRYEFKIDQAAGFVAAASILNSTLLGDNDLIAAGLIVADTATAVMKSLSINPYDYGNVAVLIATGLAQLSQVGSSTPSSAGAGGGSSSSNQQQQQQPQQENFTPETSSLNFSDATNAGGTTNTIRFATDSGDELMDTIAKLLMKGQKEGRF
jgi:hypothetical protein